MSVILQSHNSYLVLAYFSVPDLEAGDQSTNTSRTTFSSTELDHYLWISGMYLKWLKECGEKRPRINASAGRA